MWPLPNLPCELPTATVPEFIDLKSLVEHFQLVFNDVQEEHFVKGAIWRDLFAMTGTLRTFYSASSIAGAWQATASTHLPSKFVIDGEPRVIQAGPSAWVEMSFTFETNGIPATIGYGYISVVPESDGKWRIWQLRTILEQLKSHPDVDVLQPANTESVSETHRTRGELATNGVQPHLHQNGETSTSYGHEDYFDCLIIGGGQAGLSVGGRLKALGVSYVILDKHENVGDNWKTRYDSTKLHTVREFAHLPFERTFPASYPEFLPKDDLASGYRKWASKYDINVWLSTTVTSGTWSTEEKTWRLELLRDGKKSSVCGGNIVFAVGGNSQFPLSPTYENKSQEEIANVNSSRRGRRYAPSWDGIDVVPAEHYRETHDRVYKESIPTTVSDRLFFSGPAVLGRIMGSRSLHAKARKEPERFDALEKAGFLLDRDGDISYYLFQRFGGHYMDVGTSAKIASGLVNFLLLSILRPARS
ncbi:hypothetical protein AUP68_11038 [Ilyonectria robusta]